MSSSTHDDLQSGQNNSNQAPADVPPECRLILERTARLVSKKGLEMEKRIMRFNVGNKTYNFMRSSDPHHAFYQHKISEYRAARNQDGAEDNIQPDAPATLECVRPASRFRDPLPPLEEPHCFPTETPEEITLKELGTMKLTAQFVARYGMYFLGGLVTRVTMNPQFDFLKERESERERESESERERESESESESDSESESYSRSDYFSELVRAYSRVLKPSEKLSKKGACTETLLNGFFEHLLQLEKQEEMAASDLHAFVGAVDYFAQMESSANVPPPEHLPMMMNTPPQMQPLMQQPLPEEPETKRQKFDEPALVPEDPLLAQLPGSSRIRVDD